MVILSLSCTQTPSLLRVLASRPHASHSYQPCVRLHLVSTLAVGNFYILTSHCLQLPAKDPACWAKSPPAHLTITPRTDPSRHGQIVMSRPGGHVPVWGTRHELGLWNAMRQRLVLLGPGAGYLLQSRRGIGLLSGFRADKLRFTVCDVVNITPAGSRPALTDALLTLKTQAHAPPDANSHFSMLTRCMPMF